MTIEQASTLLSAAYRAEVAYRHRQFIHDKETACNIKTVANYLVSDSAKFGLMLCGPCGNGKTTMARAIRNATNLLNNGGYLDGVTAGIVLRDAVEITRDSRNVETFRKIRAVPNMVIEDMGREPTEVVDYGNMISPVIDLLEYRYDEQLFTLITTNLTPKNIREKYGDRIADRLNEMVETVVFEQESYRCQAR